MKHNKEMKKKKKVELKHTLILVLAEASRNLHLNLFAKASP
jgi:hypothetical protein